MRIGCKVNGVWLAEPALAGPFFRRAVQGLVVLGPTALVLVSSDERKGEEGRSTVASHRRIQELIVKARARAPQVAQTNCAHAVS